MRSHYFALLAIHALNVAANVAPNTIPRAEHPAPYKLPGGPKARLVASSLPFPCNSRHSESEVLRESHRKTSI